MKKGYLFVAVVLSTAGCVSHKVESSSCGHPASSQKIDERVEKVVPLRLPADVPGLYLMAGKKAILMRTEDVVALLRESVAGSARPSYYGQLLAAIRANPPTSERVDLYRYSIESTPETPLPEYIAAELLQSGMAAVVDLWRGGEVLPHISVVSFKSRGGEWREFCDPLGNQVLFISDVIND